VEELGRIRALLAASNPAAALDLMGTLYRQAVEAADWSVAAFLANWMGQVHEASGGALADALTWFDQATADAVRSGSQLPGTLATAAFNAGLVLEGQGRTTAAVRRYEMAAKAAGAADNGALEAESRLRWGILLAELGQVMDGHQQLAAAEALARRTGLGSVVGAGRRHLKACRGRLEADPATQFDLLGRAGLARCLGTIDDPCPKVILDAGCGGGAGLEALAQRWPAARVVGVDLPDVAASVRLPRSLRSRVDVQGIDLTAPVGPLPVADVALCHAVLHEVADPTPLLRTLTQAIRPGGQLVGACFTTDYYRDIWSQLEQAGFDPPRPPFRHRPEAVEAALGDAGFTDVETWVEDVAMQISVGQEQPYLERVLRQSLKPEQLVHLLAAIQRPAVLDLSPLHFRARVREG
jgi:SAM-dependent methyltransferase